MFLFEMDAEILKQNTSKPNPAKHKKRLDTKTK